MSDKQKPQTGRRFEDHVKVGDGMICYGNNVVVGPNTFAATIWSAEEAFVKAGEWLARATDDEASFEAYKALKQVVEVVKSRWGHLKRECEQLDCFTRSDLRSFEKKLWAWLDTVTAAIHQDQVDEEKVWSHGLEKGIAEILRATDRSKEAWGEARGVAAELMGDAVAIENSLADRKQAASRQGSRKGPRALKVRKPARKRGRPSDTNHKADKKIFDAWSTGRYRVCCDLASELNKPLRDVRLAIDRHRHRLTRKQA